MEDKKLNAGRVGLTMKGAWNASQSYEKLNCVSHNGRSWAAKKNVSAGVEPSAANSEFWQMMSDRGEQGIQGPVGPQGNSAFDGTGVEIVNNLTQGGQSAVLSAEQGKVLKTELTELESEVARTDGYKYNLAWVQDKYLNSKTGKFLSAGSMDYYATEDYYPVTEGQKIVCNINMYAANEAGVAFYAEDKTFIIGYGVRQTTQQNLIVEVPSGARYARFGHSVIQDNKIPLEDAFIMTDFKSENLKEIEQLANSAIEKADAANEKVNNIISLTDGYKYGLAWVQDKYLNSKTGKFLSAGSMDYYATEDYYPVTEGQKIECYINMFGSNEAGVAFYDENKVYIKGLQIRQTTQQNIIIDIPSGARYARFGHNIAIDNNIAIDDTYVMVISLSPSLEKIEKEVETMKASSKDYYPSAKSMKVAGATPFSYVPRTMPIDHSYKGEVNTEKKYLAIGFDDFRDSDFSMVVPLFEKYGFKVELNNIIQRTSIPTISEIDNKKLESVVYGGHEIGDHTIAHCQYIFNSPLWDGKSFPTNEQMRADRGDGNNVFGLRLSANITATLLGTEVDNTWGALTDAECQRIRETYSLICDHDMCDLYDTLSNKYLGTEGHSYDSDSWDGSKLTKGVFAGCKTSQNHEVWERILLLTQIYYKEQYGLNYNIKTWSMPGSKNGNLFFIDENGIKYYDSAKTKMANNLARFESSYLKNDDGTIMARSWTDVLADFGYCMSHDNFPPSYKDSNARVAMAYQLIYNASESRKNAIPYPTNFYIDYLAPSTSYPKDFFEGKKSKAVEMYDDKSVAGTPFRTYVENIRKATSNGIVAGGLFDSVDTYSSRVFFEELLKWCKAVGIEVITKASAYDICFNHSIKNGNLIYNPKLRNTAEEYFKDSQNLPSNPDGYNGDCEVIVENNERILNINGITTYNHFGIPSGKIKYSVKAKGEGTIIIKIIRNKSDFYLSGLENIARININSADWEEYSAEFSINQPSEGEYEQVCAGLGDKICGIMIHYYSGVSLKDIAMIKL